MKELSIEEKAKRYDEAIKLVNTKWYYKNQPCFINVSELFPEFKENKDENIKKWLIEYFQEFKSTGIEGFANGLKIDSIVSWLEKQGEQKPVNKVESKFKVGDWIIDKQGFAHQIENVVENVTNHTFGYDIVGGGYFNDNSDVHFWTIEDAKDGDILYFDDNTIVIFKDLYNSSTFHSYCHIEDNVFGISKDDMPDWWEGEGFQPATEEQRNLLFTKMKEAGYEWNADKKVLNKITAISKTQTSQYCYILNYNTGEAFKHHITEDEVNLTTEKLLKKYGFKETECHIMYSSNNLELKLLEN